MSRSEAYRMIRCRAIDAGDEYRLIAAMTHHPIGDEPGGLQRSQTVTRWSPDCQ
jgi:hypothetical protein